MDILWDLYQQGQIRDAQGRVASANARATDAVTQVRMLEDRVDRLTMICLAMWTLLKESGKFTDEELVNLVREVDLTDGKLDGKYRVETTLCPSCKRTMAAKHRKCIYCGAERPNEGSVQGLL